MAGLPPNKGKQLPPNTIQQVMATYTHSPQDDEYALYNAIKKHPDSLVLVMKPTKDSNSLLSD